MTDPQTWPFSDKRVIIEKMAGWYNPDICDECVKLKKLDAGEILETKHGNITVKQLRMARCCECAESEQPCIETGIIYKGEKNGS